MPPELHLFSRVFTMQLEVVKPDQILKNFKKSRPNLSFMHQAAGVFRPVPGETK